MGDDVPRHAGAGSDPVRGLKLVGMPLTIELTPEDAGKVRRVIAAAKP